jgi:hypothetical protein
MSGALLSRFDLVFILLDRAGEDLFGLIFALSRSCFACSACMKFTSAMISSRQWGSFPEPWTFRCLLDGERHLPRRQTEVCFVQMDMSLGNATG